MLSNAEIFTALILALVSSLLAIKLGSSLYV